jgi:hypothetical protein
MGDARRPPLRPDSSAESISLDGRRFRPVEYSRPGEADLSTTFAYHEADGVVWARYEGGPVALGFLVGRRSGVMLTFRYSHLNQAGETASGVCDSTIELLDDGRLRMEEHWRWESRAGEGRSAVEELRKPFEPRS